MTLMKRDTIPTKLLWVDLEMTWLDPSKDVILEIAAEVTDFAFNKIASYEARIRHEHDVVSARMDANPWWADYPENRDEFLARLKEGKKQDTVEDELIALVREHFSDEPAILAGNSIHTDRGFIKQWMPRLDRLLHYRMLDVTAWKIIMAGKYGVTFDKQEAHRAYDDIQESIAELQFYLKQLKGSYGS